MTHTTRDGMILEVGTAIYYTGDMANHEAFGKITNIEMTRWGLNIRITFDSDKRDSVLHPAQFEPGPGRRFMTKERFVTERQARIDCMRREMEARRAAR